MLTERVFVSFLPINSIITMYCFCVEELSARVLDEIGNQVIIIE
ncbi:hypothetical protein [Candidatus Endolissoclinum faulkneri]|nr:hypothetical protein [Candidatus Endolissoclinum faulkneri]